jgi:hypothetical protein
LFYDDVRVSVGVHALQSLPAELGLHKAGADQSDIYVIGHLLAKGNRHGEHGMLACDISRALGHRIEEAVLGADAVKRNRALV